MPRCLWGHPFKTGDLGAPRELGGLREPQQEVSSAGTSHPAVAPSVPGGRPATLLLLFLLPPALPDAASPRHQEPLSASTASQPPGSCPGSHPGRAGSRPHASTCPSRAPSSPRKPPSAGFNQPTAVFLVCSRRERGLKGGVGHGDRDGLRTAESRGLQVLRSAAPRPSQAPGPCVIVTLTSP